MPLLSDYAKQKKIKYFLNDIRKDANILEIGSGSQWVGKYLKENGWKRYVGIDLLPPADIVGDIRQWKTLGLKEKSFDVIIAFEVVEHIEIMQECYELLNEDGVLMVTTPMPHMDWLLRVLEWMGLNQKRTSPHSNLKYLNSLPLFRPVEVKHVALLSQWGKFKKRDKKFYFPKDSMI